MFLGSGRDSPISRIKFSGFLANCNFWEAICRLICLPPAAALSEAKDVTVVRELATSERLRELAVWMVELTVLCWL